MTCLPVGYAIGRVFSWLYSLGLIRREVFGGCFLRFSGKIYRIFVFISLRQWWQDWAYWDDFVVFVIFVVFGARIYVKIWEVGPKILLFKKTN